MIRTRYTTRKERYQYALACCIIVGAWTLLFSTSTYAQVVAIDPNGAGGFELATDFAGNGWTATLGGYEGSTSYGSWRCGTTAMSSNGGPVRLGDRGAFIGFSNTSYAYSSNSTPEAGRAHLFRPFTVPVGATDIELSFRLRCAGQANTDNLLVFTGTGTPSTNGPSGTQTTLTNYTSQFVVTSTTTYSATNTSGGFVMGTLVEVPLPTSLATGTSHNLLFTWKHNMTLGIQPPASIDNVSLTYNYCNGDPNTGTALASPEISCDGSSTLSLPSLVSAPGLSYQWQNSTNNVDFANINGANSAIYNAVGPASTTYFRCIVTCPNTGGTGQSGGQATSGSASVTAEIPLPGTDSVATLCSTGPAQDLTPFLGADALPGGTWSGPSPSMTGIFDPATMVAGVYTYTVSGVPPCPDVVSTVDVQLDPCLGIAEEQARNLAQWLGQTPNGEHLFDLQGSELQGWQLLDATGKLVNEERTTPLSGQIRLVFENAGPGLHIVRLMTDRGVVPLRIMHMPE